MQETFGENFCFYFIFPCIPCPFTVLLQRQSKPNFGLTTEEPNLASKALLFLPSVEIGDGNGLCPG